MTMAVKTASLKQLSAITAYACSKGGFPTVNRHLHIEELAGLGWVDLQPLCDDPALGQKALATSLATLVWNPLPCAVHANLQSRNQNTGVTRYMRMPWS